MAPLGLLKDFRNKLVVLLVVGHVRQTDHYVYLPQNGLILNVVVLRVRYRNIVVPLVIVTEVRFDLRLFGIRCFLKKA